MIFRRRRKIGLAEVPDSQWAPPYEPDETVPYVRTPEPWPPPPPAPPAQPEPEEAPRAEAPAASSRRSPSGRVVAIGVAAAVVAAWVGVAALAAPAHTKTNTALDGTTPETVGPQAPNGYGAYGRRGTAGVVQSVDGATVTLLDGNGDSVAVHTTTATTFVKTVAVTVSDVKLGDTIVASGVYSDANATLTAGRIAILDAGGGQGTSRGLPVDGGNSATGTVGAVAGDHLTLNLFDGSALTVLITPQVMVTAPVAGSLSDLTKGKTITVRGQVGDNGDVNAYQIQEGAIFGREPLANTGSLGLTPGRVVQS